MFSDRLKERLKNKGVTQKEVAEFLSIKERSYLNYEYRNSEAPYATLSKLAGYFQVSIDYLLGRTDNPTMY